MQRQLLIASCILTLSMVACEKPAQQPKVEKPKATQPATPAPAKAKAEATPKPKYNNACVGATATGKAHTFKIGSKEWELDGSTLTEKTADNDKQFIIGAVTDVKEPSKENLGNIQKIVGWLKSKKVDMVVMAGDSGDGVAQIKQTLSALAAVDVPLAVVIGNREGIQDFEQALKEVQATHKNIINLNKVRRINAQHADIISLPGYYDADYLHHEAGCVYTADDVNKLSLLAKFTDSPMVLVSHGPLRQSAKTGIDVISEGDNRGDPRLTAAIQQAKIPFGIFGNIHEAGGRATNLNGSEVIKQGEFVDALYLNPGPVDSVQWKMNDGTESVGMAGIMTIQEGKAAYEIFRLPVPKAAKGQ